MGSKPSPTGAQKGIHSPRLRHKEESDEKMTMALKGMTQSGMRNLFLCFCFEVFRLGRGRGQGTKKKFFEGLKLSMSRHEGFRRAALRKVLQTDVNLLLTIFPTSLLNRAAAAEPRVIAQY